MSLLPLRPLVPPRCAALSSTLGTMVGDDASTGAFKRWWEAEAVVRGGVLAYNTGRSLESFKQLLDGKRHCLAHPDVLISAVGTKIYKYDGSSWSEDAGWTRMLDAGGWSVKVGARAGGGPPGSNHSAQHGSTAPSDAVTHPDLPARLKALHESSSTHAMLVPSRTARHATPFVTLLEAFNPRNSDAHIVSDTAACSCWFSIQYEAQNWC